MAKMNYLECAEDVADIIQELESWKNELDPDRIYDEIIYNTIETFEDMLVNR